MTYIDLTTACDRIELFAREGRLIGAIWRGERNGNKVANIYGAVDPNINSVYDCPSSVGPLWLRELVINLFNGLIDNNAQNACGLRYAQALRNTEQWSTERWNTTLVEFLCLVIDQSHTAARTMTATTDCGALDSKLQWAKQVLREWLDLSTTAMSIAARGYLKIAAARVSHATRIATYAIVCAASGNAVAVDAAAYTADYAVGRAASVYGAHRSGIYYSARNANAIACAAAHSSLLDALIDLLSNQQNG